MSEQTVARRYRRLRGEGLLRVIGLVDPRSVGQSEWMVRVGCRPGGVGRLAEALARRDDVSWVTLTAGGSEIVCSVRSRSAEQRDELLLQRLPATSQVLTMEVYAVLHRFVGGASTDWTGYGEALRPDQIEAMLAAAGIEADPGAPRPRPVSLRPEDGPLLDELAVDGRASYAALAAAGGHHRGPGHPPPGGAAPRGHPVLRRGPGQRADGLHGPGLPLADGRAGQPGGAWASSSPGTPRSPFAAAVSGSANLAASILCRDVEDLYRYVTTRSARWPASGSWRSRRSCGGPSRPAPRWPASG